MQSQSNKTKDAPTGDNPNRLLNEHEVAALLGHTVRALQGWRVKGGGPRFVKISGRSVRYRLSDVLAWIEARIIANTSEYKAAS